MSGEGCSSQEEGNIQVQLGMGKAPTLGLIQPREMWEKMGNLPPLLLFSKDAQKGSHVLLISIIWAWQKAERTEANLIKKIIIHQPIAKGNVST